MSRRGAGPWVLAALIFTGFAALAFEVAWSRALIPWVGGTAMAQVMTVAVYMLGLFLGSRIAATRSSSRPHPARDFIAIEAAAALLSTIAILGLPWAEPWIALFARGSLIEGDLGSALRGAAGGLLMLPATICMGLAFPLAIEALRRERGGVDSAALAYGLNTLGATAGTVAAGLVLLPALGVATTTWSVVLVDAAALAVAAWALRSNAGEAPVAVSESATRAPTPHMGRDDLVLLLCVTFGGVVSLALEIVFFRILGMLLGPTARAFTVVLGSYVLGLGLGALAVQPLLRRRPARAPIIFTCCWVGVGVFGLVMHAALGGATEWFLLSRTEDGVSLTWELARRAGVAAALLLPLTVLFGASYPAAVACARRDTAAAAGRLYAWLTLGNVAGLFIAAIGILPLWGAEVGARVLFGVALFVGVPLLWTRTRMRAVWTAGAVTAVAALAWFAGPRWDWHLLNSAPYYYGSSVADGARARFLLLEPGFETTVAVTQLQEERYFTLDGKTDGSTTRFDQMTQSLCGVLPTALHPAPSRALLIGAGTGQSAADMLSLGVERLDCAELSEGVITALPYFEEINRGVERDPRFHLLATDGRTVLRYSDVPYDVIMSEPSNLWVPGVAHLFTRETFAEVSERLAPGGVFCQWLHAYALQEETFWTVVRTLLDVFPHVTLFKTSFLSEEALFIASNEPLQWSFDELEQRLADAQLEDHSAPGRALDAAGLLRFFVADTETLRQRAGDGPTTTDGRPRLEYAAERSMLDPSAGVYHDVCAAITMSASRVVATTSPEQRALLDRLADANRDLLAFLSDDRVERSQYDELAEEYADDPQARSLLASLLLQNVDRARQANRDDLALEFLNQAVSFWPGHEEASRRLVDLLSAQGKNRRARDVLQSYRSQAFRDRAWMFVRSGRLHVAQRNARAAQSDFERALQLDDEALAAYTGLANCATLQGDAVKARQWLQRALARDPENAPLREHLARLRRPTSR